MKKILLIGLCLSIIQSVFGQSDQEQSDTPPYYYKVKGLVYVYDFDLANDRKDLAGASKIPKAPLIFKVVAEKTDPADGSTYYVIKFPPIINGGGKIDAFRGDPTFINSGDNSKYFWISQSDLDDYVKNGFILERFRAPDPQFTYGASVALPFKLRPRIDGNNIKLIPELTLGGYMGLKLRLSHSKPFYLSVPVVTLGLATLTLNEESAPKVEGDGTILGITGSVGAIFEFKDFQFGVLVGWDRAAGEIGKDWIYNGKPWYSFSIGYSFLGKK